MAVQRAAVHWKRKTKKPVLIRAISEGEDEKQSTGVNAPVLAAAPQGGAVPRQAARRGRNPRLCRRQRGP